MKISHEPVQIADLVSNAEAIIEYRELQEPAEWAMTAFSRYRVLELLGTQSIPPYGGVEAASPAELLEQATAVAEKLVVPTEQSGWHQSLVEALRCALADVRMVRGACDI